MSTKLPSLDSDKEDQEYGWNKDKPKKRVKVKISDVEGLSSVLSEKSPLLHRHHSNLIIGLDETLDQKADLVHNHKADQIVSGVLNIDRIPDIPASKIIDGPINPVDIPDLDASKITTGVFDPLRIPDLDAAKITTGTFNTSRIPGLDASKIVSGSFHPDRIPNLSASKITSGTFDVLRIPDLAISKITNLQSTLDGKQATITGAASSITIANLPFNRALISDGAGKVAFSSTTETELSYSSGVTSAIQTQINSKQATITGGATSIVSANLTSNRAVISDASGKVAISAVTSTELGFVSGTTSNIQDQINNIDASKWITNVNDIYNGNTGNVGIKISVPLAPLHVNVTGNDYVARFTNSNGNNLAIYCDNTSDVPCQIGTTSNHKLGFFTNNGTANILVMDTNSNVSIGIATALGRLHVNKTHTAGSINTTSIDLTEADVIVSSVSSSASRKDAGMMFFANASTSTSYASAEIKSGWADAGSTDWNKSYIDFKTHGTNSASFTSDMRIQGGNVGIGITAPTSTLHVFKNTTASTSITTLGNSRGTYTFDINSSSGYTASFLIDDTALNIGTNSAARGLIFKTNSTERMTIQGNGNVGIGTNGDDPTRLVHLSSSAATYTRTATTAGSGNSYLIGQDGDRVALWTNYNTLADSGWSERFTIKNGTGNVGIGKNTPIAKLDVNGNIKESDVFLSNKYQSLKKNITPTNSVSAWTARAVPIDNGWISVCWSPELNLFCAVADSGGTSANRVMTSPDGITWTSRAATGSESWSSVCWSPELGLFCAVASFGGSAATRIMTSTNGSSWTVQTAANTNGWRSVCWSPELGLFCAVADTGGTASDRIMTSPNGTTWTARAAPNTNYWWSVCWSAELGIFCAVAYNGGTASDRIMTSTDGITWTVRAAPNDNGWISVCWSPQLGLFCAVANAGGAASNRVMTSPDGITWTARPAPNTNSWRSVAWSPELGTFCAVANSFGTASDRIMTSTDGLSWSVRTAPSTNGWVSICWSPTLGCFCSVAISGAVAVNRAMTSTYTVWWATNGTKIFANEASLVGIGTHNPTSKLDIISPDGTTTTAFYRQTTSSAVMITSWASDWGSTNRLVARVLSNGDLQNWNNSYGAISDLRLKTNIAPANTQINDIKSLNFVKFEFKDEVGNGDGFQQLGLIAQEVDKICPHLVHTDTDEMGTKSIKYSVLYMKNVKATQELIEKVEELEAQNKDLLTRLERLENLINLK